MSQISIEGFVQYLKEHSYKFEKEISSDVLNIYKTNRIFETGETFDEISDDYFHKEILITCDDLKKGKTKASFILGVDIEHIISKIVEEKKKYKKVIFAITDNEEKLQKAFEENLDKIKKSAEKTMLKSLFQLRVDRTGQYLLVFDDKKNKPSFEEIKFFLNNNNIFVKDIFLKSLVRKASGNPLKIGDWQADTYRDASIELSIENNNTEIFAIITPPCVGGKEIDKEDINNILKIYNIIVDLDKSWLNQIIKYKIYNRKIFIARSNIGQPSEDAYLDYKFNLNTAPLEYKENEEVDFKELNKIISVKKGDILIEKKFPMEGIDGIDVFGNKITYPPPRDINIYSGKNTILSKNGLILRSLIDGHIVEEKKKISVRPFLIIYGDIGAKTGNVRYPGSVKVLGSIEDGYEILVEGNLLVEKSIGASKVEVKGDIIVGQGITGKGNTTVESFNGSIYCKFAQNVVLSAHSKLVVKEFLLNVEANSMGSVYLDGKKATIIGGITRALYDIQAKIYGSDVGVPTVLEVGISPTVRINLKKSIDIVKIIENKIDQLESQVIGVDKNQLTDEKFENYQNLIQDLNNAKNDLSIAKDDIVIYKEYIKNSKIKGRIVAVYNVCQSVKMRCNTAELEHFSPQGPSFYIVSSTNSSIVKYNVINKVKRLEYGYQYT